jgi:hypothetical protein
VTATLGLGEIQPAGQALDLNFNYDFESGLVPEAWTNHSLDMDDEYTISLFDALHMYGDRQGSIQIVVRYHAWFLPWTFTRRFRFETRRQSNGKLYWYSLPAK